MKNAIAQKINWIGIDVSKRELEIHSYILNSGLPSSIPNTDKGRQDLIKILLKIQRPHLVFESTGGYETPLLKLLQDHGIMASRINPNHSNSFAKALGIHAKTDKIDAEILTIFGQKLTPGITSKIDPETEVIQHYIKYRNKLMMSLHQQKMELEHEKPKCLTKIIEKSIVSLKKQILKIEEAIEKKVNQNTILKSSLAVLIETDGVGKITAYSLLTLMPELGRITNRQASSLAGLAPFNKDSGTHNGKRTLKGGRANVRKSIYMAALSASKYNPILKAFYERLQANGKPKKLALTAVMRKLLCYLNGQMKKHLDSLQDTSSKSAITPS